MTGTYQQLLCRLCSAALLVCLLSSLCACGDAACPSPAQVVSDRVIPPLPAGQTESCEQYSCLTWQQDSLRITVGWTNAMPPVCRNPDWW